MPKIFPAKTDQDTKIIKELFGEYGDSLGLDLSFQNFEEELVNLPGDYGPPMGCLLIATHQGQTAGCVGLRPFGEGACEMKRLYVRKEFRRLGISRALAEAVIEWGRSHGYTSMRLNTNQKMVEAIGLYTSLGFKEIGPYEHVSVEDLVFMELKLV